MLSDRFAAGIIERLRESAAIAAGEHHAEIGSTNDRAATLVSGDDVETPYLVLSERQFAGRGRGSNVWWSAPGALTFSLIVDPSEMNLPTARLGLVSLATALAIAGAARRRTPDLSPRLKWPNDVYIAGRKLSGILVEVPPARPEKVVIGVGVNANNSFAAAPFDVQERAISLVDAGSAASDLEELLRDLIAGMATKLIALANEPVTIVAEFREFCLLTGRQVAVETPTGAVRGICLGIDDEGALRIRTTAGEARCFAGVVSDFAL